MRSQDRTVFSVDTYVYLFRLVYGDRFHVLSVSYPDDNGAAGRFTMISDPEG
jgi:hypothetical protein